MFQINRFYLHPLYLGYVIIKRLCTFKDDTIKGELYSRGFYRHFKTESEVFSQTAHREKI
ncbi:mobilization protein [Prevotella sp. MGM2]|nr:mobilization protein [Prevotella sp. MGM2]